MDNVAPTPAPSEPAAGEPSPLPVEGTPDKPLLALEPAMVLCSQHGLLFQPCWPGGFVPFALEATQKVMAQPHVAEECGGKIERIQEILRETPLCCRLTVEELSELAAAALGEFLVIDFCTRCHLLAGGWYRTKKEAWRRKPKPRFHCLTCLIKAGE
jgi:hypothetical protein